MPYLHKHPNSPYWSVWFTDENGQRTSRSTKLRKKREAQKLAFQWEEDARAAREWGLTAAQALRVYNGLLSRSGQKVTAETVEAFATRWIASKRSTRSTRTAITYEPVVAAFVKSLGLRAKAPLTAIGVADIERHRDGLIQQKKKASTVRQALKIIGAMFATGLRQGVVDANPVRSVEFNDAPPEQRSPFTSDEIRSLLSHASFEWKTVILFGAYAGMRLGDAVRLRWESVDLGSLLITFTPEKTSRKGRVVTIPISVLLHEHLMTVPRDAAGFVSPNLAARGTGGRDGLSRQFNALMREAGIENRVIATGGGKGRTQKAKSFHSLRHSFNTALLSAGVDERIRMALSGHTTAQVNRSYSHAELETLKAAVAKIA